MHLILYSEQKNRLRVFVMWTLKFSCDSNQTPTLRTLFTVATLASPIVRVSRLTLLSCWRVSINMTSVLLSLSFSQSACIHTLMVRIHCSTACTASTKGLTKGVIWVEGRINLSIVSKSVCVGQVQLDDLEQLAGIGTEE